MRILAIILIAIGILMAIFTGIDFQTKKKVVDIGPVEINKKEDKHLGWPVWTGGIIALAGVAILIGGKKK